MKMAHPGSIAFLAAVILIGGLTSTEAQFGSRNPQTENASRAVKSRSDVQSAATAGQTQPGSSSGRQVATDSAWPGLVRPVAGVSASPASTSTGLIRQMSAKHPIHLPPTGPVILGAHRKRVRDYSWIYIDPPEVKEIRLHDIITINVDEKSEIIMNSRFNRQKNSRLKAEIKEFIRLGETGNLAPAALNGPTIDTQLQGNLNTTGQVTDQEGIKYRIAATVVDVLPNGVLQLEARKVIQTQDDISEYTLTGELRATDVGPDNQALSENIANLKIVKNQKGRVYDSTKRNWGYRLYDLLFPF